MSGTSHLKYMLLGGAGLFGVMVLLGLPLQSALFLAIALACPLMMVFMMGGGHSGHTGHGEGHVETRGPRAADRVDRGWSRDTTHDHH